MIGHGSTSGKTVGVEDFAKLAAAQSAQLPTAGSAFGLQKSGGGPRQSRLADSVVPAAAGCRIHKHQMAMLSSDINPTAIMVTIGIETAVIGLCRRCRWLGRLGRRFCGSGRLCHDIRSGRDIAHTGNCAH